MFFITKRGQERTTEVTFNLQGSSGVFHIIVLILSLLEMLTFEKHLLSFNRTCSPCGLRQENWNRINHITVQDVSRCEMGTSKEPKSSCVQLT